MARPKKNKSEILLGILDSYYAETGDNTSAGLKFSKLEKYAAEKGIEAKAYDFRRDDAVRHRIEELKKRQMQSGNKPVASYKTMDTDKLLYSSKTPDDLRKKLSEQDSYWKRISEASDNIRKENQMLLKEKTEKDKELQTLHTETEKIRSHLISCEKENKRLVRENRYLRSMLRKYLYPDLANSLLRDEKLPVSDNKSANQAALNELVEGKRPMPFPGTVSQKKETAKNRPEQILEKMRKQVETT